MRETHGYSQQVVADYLGMTQANYHKLESDKAEIRLEYIEKLAGFYKVPVADIIADRHVYIQNNSHNHNVGIITSAEKEKIELLTKHIAVLEEMLKLKDEKIALLEKQIKTRS